ncbi:copper resistance system multicopper oxidase [Bordetella genomosp. 1]|uniref:Copper oxidase n=1 Tax=Bordetella genomosp. 1 TaxID=1395607 RepID=A0ABX4F522_9BORD|nr:copper resistance system multicopper oxidase [Bordetella genomosp. 1]OZI68865.1 copper oxidase [Bordetella genomosp. 1]
MDRSLPLQLSRRRFVCGIAAGGVLATLGAWRARPALAAAPDRQAVLSGTEFHLEIGNTPVNFTGAPRIGTTINGLIPGPVLHWREGDTVTMHVTNRLAEDTSIHWHGILVPHEMDGVPGMTFDGIAPGQTFTYRFKVKQHGTFWYHSHSGFQEQTGVYAPLVISPRDAPPAQGRDYTVMLSDWTDEDPETVFRKLKAVSHVYNTNMPTVAALADQAGRDGWGAALSERLMWDKMRMNAGDLADVSALTYTFLVNGKTPAGNWTGLFTPGEQVRLRLINGSAMTYFDVRLPGLKMTVVSADGQEVHPVEVDELRIGVAETYDVIVHPDDRAYTLFAQSMDRSGYARATLAPRAGMQAAVPAVDPVQRLTMQDMGMDMSQMDMAGMDMGGKDMAGMDMGGMKMDGKAAPSGHAGMPMPMNMPMPGMDHGAMGHGAPMAMDGRPQGAAAGGMVVVKHHDPAEYGVAQDMIPAQVSTRLDDPGAGLRGNGRRVLTYADLRSLVIPADNLPPTREIELHLTGNMDRFMWSFNGKTFGDADPIVLHYGERVRFVLVNDTMMSHPIHLHGMWSDVESPDGRFQVRKHTVSLHPAQRITYRVHADARGNWAYHCHLLYHMDAGMFRAVVVA